MVGWRRKKIYVYNTTGRYPIIKDLIPSHGMSVQKDEKKERKKKRRRRVKMIRCLFDILRSII